MCAPSVVESALAGLGRRDALRLAAGLVAAALPGVARGAADEPPAGRPAVTANHVVDLTHTLSPAFPIFPAPVNFPIRITNIANPARDGYFANKWEVVEHHGTHLDAPGHFAPKGTTADRLDPRKLVVPAAVIDIRERARRDADTVATVDDFKSWEKAHGRLPKGCCVFLNSGWDVKAGDAKAYLGQDGTKTLHFPGFSKEACEWLLSERDVAGLAVDTLSLDHGPSKDFAAHRLWLGAGRWGLECVASLSELPPSGATVVVGAPKVIGASGGPARVLALWG